MKKPKKTKKKKVLKKIENIAEDIKEEVVDVEKKSVKKIKKHKIISIGITIFILIAIFVISAPTRTASVRIEVPYQDTEYYTVQESYETKEPYKKQEAYSTTETYIDTIPVEKDVAYTDYEYYYDETTNCNSASNCQCVDTSWWTGECIKCYCSRPVTKYRQEIVNEQIRKTRPVTKYRTVTEYRTVTKYKDVQKSRQVTNWRTETKDYEVNWLMNFKVPWRLHIF